MADIILSDTDGENISIGITTSPGINLVDTDGPQIDIDTTGTDNLARVAFTGSYNDLSDKPSAGTGDMTKAVYDINNDGVVDNSQLLQGQNSSYHLSRANHTDTQAIATITGLQTALDGKEPTIAAGTTSQYYRGDKTFQTLDKTAVGLANVDNTSDANKPVSTAQQTALNAKQNTLVSGTNIKTINGNPLLGSGDLVISGGGGGQSVLTTQASQTANFTATANSFYPVNAAGGGVTVTLPTSTANQWLFIKKTDSTMNAVTMSGTINGAAANIPLRKPNQGKMLYADNSGGWNILVGDLDLTTIDALQQNVLQTAHGFTVGQLVYSNGTNFVLSQADAPANAEVDGMVVAVPNANQFVLLIRGYFTALSGLTAGSYFLSATAAGGYTQTAPSTVGQVNKPLFRAISATTGYFNNYRGITVAASGGGGITRSVNQVTAAATAGSASNIDYAYYWTGSTTFNMTMPAVSGNTNRYTFINRSTVSQTVVGTFNGNTNIVISPNSVREFISNNTDWMVL